MRSLVLFLGLMAFGLSVAVMALGFATGFDARGAAMAAGQHGLDMRSYTVGLAVGIVATNTLRFGLGAFMRRIANALVRVAPGMKLAALALVFGGILIFY